MTAQPYQGWSQKQPVSGHKPSHDADAQTAARFFVHKNFIEILRGVCYNKHRQGFSLPCVRQGKEKPCAGGNRSCFGILFQKGMIE